MKPYSLLRSACLAGLSGVLAAEEAVPTINTGDTAWMIVATALVLLMTLPGLALFYGGLVRAKNVLSVLVQCVAMAGIMSLLWAICGYSLAFSDGGSLNTWIGGLDHLFLAGVTRDAVSGSIPTSVWVLFQGTFFIITPALIAGAFAERMKFSAMVLFSVLWSLLCYLPLCHMAWGGGLFHHWGVLDYAGGTVVHINAGIAALVAALMIGKRAGYLSTPMKPHNLTMTVTGAALLWVGWFGFNAGSAGAAGADAGMALLTTHLAAAAGVCAWSAVEWLRQGKPSALGAVSGAVAGLVAITPAAGVAGPMGAIGLGLISGVACFYGAVVVKHRLGYDDALDAFGVHGVGGIIGAVLTGLVLHPLLGGNAVAEFSWGDAVAQMGWQAASVLVTLLWSGVLSWIILLVVRATVGLRVSSEAETLGLDVEEHGEQGYILGA